MQTAVINMHAARGTTHSIELDCPPFNGPRPGDLIGGVLEGTGLEVGDFETGAPFFGNQMWVLKESSGKDLLWAELKAGEVIKNKVAELYRLGAIRYGSW